MPPRSPESLWQQLVDEAGEDLIDEAVSVSVAQAERELTAAGFDVAAERGVAETLIAALEFRRPGRPGPLPRGRA
jgi:hypothetical protein